MVVFTREGAGLSGGALLSQQKSSAEQRADNGISAVSSMIWIQKEKKVEGRRFVFVKIEIAHYQSIWYISKSPSDSGDPSRVGISGGILCEPNPAFRLVRSRHQRER